MLLMSTLLCSSSSSKLRICRLRVVTILHNPFSKSVHRDVLLSHEIYTAAPSSITENKAQVLKKSIIFMHGILGSKKNFRTAAKQIVKDRYGFNVAVTLDHRGHGKSPTPPILTGITYDTVNSCADDVRLLVKSGLLPINPEGPTVLCGHSFGGKVALLYLKQCIEAGLPLPRHTWILDSLPGQYDRKLDAMQRPDVSVSYVLHSVQSLYTNAADNFRSKDTVVEALLKRGLSNTMAQWLVTNLEPAEDDRSVKFSFDINAITMLFEDFCNLDLWSFLYEFARLEMEEPSTIHFIRAGKNPLWLPSATKRFHELATLSSSASPHENRIALHHMEHVGHWLHAEDLHGVLSIISENSTI